MTKFYQNVLRAEFPVTIDTLNIRGGLHGGFTAAVIDVVSSCILIGNGGGPGVTVELHVRYMKEAKFGDIVIVESRPIKLTDTMAFLECELRQKSDGSIIARGNQTNILLPNKLPTIETTV